MASPREQSPSKCRTAVAAAAVDAPSALVQDVDLSTTKTPGFTSPESQLAKRMLESQWSLNFIDERTIDTVEAPTSADDLPSSENVKLPRKGRGRKRATTSKVEAGSNPDASPQSSLMNSSLQAELIVQEVAAISAVSGGVRPSAAQLRKVDSHGTIRPRRLETMPLEAHTAETLPTRLIESSSSRPACIEDEAREGILLRNYGSHSAPEVDWGVKLPALTKEDEWFLATCVQRGKVCYLLCLQNL